jgi:hypothetical protein
MPTDLETIKEIARASLMPDFFGARIDEEGLWSPLGQLLSGLRPAARSPTVEKLKQIAGHAVSASDFIEKVKAARLWDAFKELVLRIQVKWRPLTARPRSCRARAIARREARLSPAPPSCYRRRSFAGAGDSLGLRILLILLVIGSCARSARADPGAAQLRYALGPDTERCPDATAMREAVSARLGYVPWRDGASRVVVVAVARAGRGLRARIELRDAAGKVQGQRELASGGSDCRELAAAVELAISLAIDPLSLARPRGARRGPRAQAHDGERTPEPQGVPARGAPVAVRRRTELSASVGGLVAFGSAPSVAGGMTVQGRLRFRLFSVALEGRFDFPAYLDVAGGRVSTSLFVGSALGCVHAWYVSGCVQLAAGGLRGSGHGLADAQSHTLAYLGTGLRLGGEIPLLSVLALRVYADVLGTLSHITLRTSDAQGTELWSTPAVSAALGLALAGRIW